MENKRRKGQKEEEKTSTKTPAPEEQRLTRTLQVSELPYDSLCRYMNYYDLWNEGTLSYRQAVLPTGPVPQLGLDTMDRPLPDRAHRKRRAPADSESFDPTPPLVKTLNGLAEEHGRRAPGFDSSVANAWPEDPLPDLLGIDPRDGNSELRRRLEAKVAAHWNQRENVKEVETIAAFLYKVRTRHVALKGNV